MELKDTVKLMASSDYKERFKAEYYQTKIRYEKLKAFNNKIEASFDNFQPAFVGQKEIAKKLEEPKHDCSFSLLQEQQSAMGRYLHILEVRAVIEGIEL